MMHEITISGISVTKLIRFGMAKSDHGECGREAWEKVHVSLVGLHRLHGGFPLGRYLHSFCR